MGATPRHKCAAPNSIDQKADIPDVSDRSRVDALAEQHGKHAD
jgi:hypothetical protein